MEKKRVFNLVIVDASGSMSSIYDQALSGVNETIATIRISQKEYENLEQHLTLCTFSAGDHFLNTIYDAEPITSVKDITSEDYHLRGCTALYDAMGDMISRLQQKITHDDLVLVTVITDGYENASRRWEGPQIKSLVEELRQMGWTFTYIGANQDVEKVAGELGVHNSLSFKADEEGTKAMFAKERQARHYYSACMSSAVQCKRSVSNELTGLFDEDEDPKEDETSQDSDESMFSKVRRMIKGK